jgi:hypothetical protein
MSQAPNPDLVRDMSPSGAAAVYRFAESLTAVTEAQAAEMVAEYAREVDEAQAAPGALSEAIEHLEVVREEINHLLGDRWPIPADLDSLTDKVTAEIAASVARCEALLAQFDAAAKTRAR